MHSNKDLDNTHNTKHHNDKKPDFPVRDLWDFIGFLYEKVDRSQVAISGTCDLIGNSIGTMLLMLDISLGCSLTYILIALRLYRLYRKFRSGKGNTLDIWLIFNQIGRVLLNLDDIGL